MAFYLVTGGSGFCGFEIVNLLIERGHKVRVLDIEKLPEKIKNVEFIEADIRDKIKVNDACKDIEIIIHTVAKVPISKAGKEFWNVNVGGTKNILEAALKNKIKKVVNISSSSVQVSDKNPIDEYEPYHAIGDYSKSKIEAENICKDFIKRGLEIDIIRPRTVVGPGRLGIFDILFEWIKEGRKVYILGRGNNKIQFIHSKDLAECCYLSSINRGSHVFNVGSKKFGALKEDLNYLIKHADTKSRVVSLPILPAIIFLKILDILRLSPLTSFHYLTYFKDFYFSNERAKKILGWKPVYDNKKILTTAYDLYLKDYEKNLSRNYGSSHRRRLKQGFLGLLKKIS